MSNVKILHRRRPMAHQPIIANIADDPEYNILRMGRTLARHRKSPDDSPITLAQRVSEFLHFNAPSVHIAADKLVDILKRFKLPIAAVIGIASVAGIAYLVYKLYKNYTAKSVESTAAEILADLKAAAPDVFGVEGWDRKLYNEVMSALSLGDESATAMQLANLKAELINHQKTIAPANVGSGLLLLPGQRHGGGLRTPMIMV